jgi:hypothetical protein
METAGLDLSAARTACKLWEKVAARDTVCTVGSD